MRMVSYQEINNNCWYIVRWLECSETMVEVLCTFDCLVGKLLRDLTLLHWIGHSSIHHQALQILRQLIRPIIYGTDGTTSTNRSSKV